jgi:hypothetical protein
MSQKRKLDSTPTMHTKRTKLARVPIIRL